MIVPNAEKIHPLYLLGYLNSTVLNVGIDSKVKMGCPFGILTSPYKKYLVLCVLHMPSKNCIHCTIDCRQSF